MRPSILDPLFAPVTRLPGVGPRIGRLFARLLDTDQDTGEPLVLDLLWHLPFGIVDRRNRPPVAEAVPGEIATVRVTVDAHRAPPRNSRAPYRVACHDATGELTLVFFNARADWLSRALPVGEQRWVSGRVEAFGAGLQMVHPDHMVAADALDRLPEVETVYSRVEGLGGRVIARAVGAALERLPELREWQDPQWLRARGWPSFGDALAAVHHPRTPHDAAPEGAAWSRLAYDELLAGQLALEALRRNMRRGRGFVNAGSGELARRVVGTLPFSLTGAQMEADREIAASLASPERMLRLLQGDVGSGKTAVALLAMARVAEAGRQSAFMAPTELLARQHMRTVAPLAEAAGLRVELLTGREKGKAREAVLARLRDGDTHILVGTHALFQSGVDFRELGLVVVDEQHRFGVHQRLALAAKGQGADMLVMTATPIPRTLLLTHYGDMDVTRLTEKPAGRKPVETRAMPLDRLDEVVSGVRRAVNAGAQVYWVCPLVEESEAVDVTSAQGRFAALKDVFGELVGLVHGQMAGRDRDEAMRRFIAGETRVLVATTVIEVGVDVPQASVMVIEHAERFGLAQLHQLRGRVGRGAARSSCVLLYRGPLGDVAHARLAIMRETEDGFRIAEEDLKLRGGGEVLGTRQSGMPGFRVARPEVHLDLIAAARDDARLIMSGDPTLAAERGEALRMLLYLFRRDAAMRLLGAG